MQNAITETGFYVAKYAYVYDYLSEEDGENANTDNTNADNKGISQEKQNQEEQNQEELNQEEQNQEATKQKETNQEETNQEETNQEETKIQPANSNDINKKIPELSSFNLGDSVEKLIAHTIDSSFYKIKLKDYIDVEKINSSSIKGGFEGIQTYLSSFMKEDSIIDIILVYKIKLPLLFIEVDDIQVVQRVRMHGWNGHKVPLKTQDTDETKENEKIVYITQTGTVYHLTKKCTHLALSIRMIGFAQIENVRNSSGGKYKQCNVCNHGELSKISQVYITDTGDRYHISLDCSGLKRTILSVPLSEVSDRSLCSRCGSESK